MGTICIDSKLIFNFLFLETFDPPKVIQYSVMEYKYATCWGCVPGGKGWVLLFFCCLVLCANIPFLLRPVWGEKVAGATAKKNSLSMVLPSV